ncbi:MAG: cyclic nucleotide-binding domain-containing protein [Candidatus Riflebacteria bacterium]|nr:cyclic nucleotide-binding domain-containing protein [Candidatus Riflebacteria bacterium]
MDQVGPSTPLTTSTESEASITKRLRNVPFLEGFSDAAIQKVVAITGETTFPARSVIFREGDRGDTLYILKSGRATISKKNRLGVNVVIATLVEGAVIGDMALIDNQPRSATLETLIQSTFFIIKESDFQKLLYNDREVTQGTLILLTDRIRRSNEKLIDFALDNHPDMVILTDTDFRVTDINKQAQNQLKMNPKEGIQPGVLGKIRFLLEKVRQQAQERNPFFLILMKPEKLFLWVHVNPLKNPQGFLQGYLIELRDITQARDSSRRSLEIASFIIHRLPGLVEKMKGFTPAESRDTSSEQTELVREINRQVNKLVAFTDLEAGPLRIQRVDMNPDQIATDVINSHQFVMAAKSQALDCRLEFGEGQIFADDDWIRKLLTILLCNAITYSEPGSLIVFQTSQPNNGRFRCRIQNPTDFTVSEDDARRFFSISQQLEDFESLRSTDFGLELPLAKHIIDAHNGRISIEPNLNNNLFSVVFEL